uniref:Anaphase-promoting complex subunit 4 WD40 domain-containing protein n=1 Tax=Spongospora subterranea TaxID=70186 RepID=A0A0H5R925_9EUKA|eukprot:CRZ10276.1 hypothetical protein [Spongospora subterranea]
MAVIDGDQIRRPSLSQSTLHKRKAPDLLCTTLSGIRAPEINHFTIAEYNLSLMTVSPQGSRLHQIRSDALSLILDKDGLRYKPVQLPDQDNDAAVDQDNGHDATFRPLFCIDDQGNPVAVQPSSKSRPSSTLVTWHPILPLIAIAMADGSVYVYNVDNRCWSIALHHRQQSSPRHIQYCTTHPNILAVLCGTHVCLWQIAPGSQSASLRILRPSDWSDSVRTRGHGSLSFNNTGRLLAFSNEGQPSICIWDLSSVSPSRPQSSLAMRLYSVSLVQFSSNGRYLVALSSSSPHFFIWDTQQWQCMRWSTGSTPAHTLSWHPTVDIMIMANIASTKIHTVRLCPLECSTGLDVGPSLDDDPLAGLGGNVKQVVWSPTSERVAVSFEDGFDCSDLIAILSTSVQHDDPIRFTPIGYIRGPSSKTANPPVAMQFRPQFDAGALLAVLWSHGQLTFYPMLFVGTRS